MLGCDARIRPMRPVNDIEMRCEADADHGGAHSSTLRDYAYPGSATVISWRDDDRRNFTGDFIECPLVGCILPANHRGRCAS